MSFRKIGGLDRAAKNNIVSSNYNSTGNLLVTKSIGQPNSVIDVESDLSGNITIHGNVIITENLDVSGNLHVGGNFDISGNLNVGGDLDISGNLYVHGTSTLNEQVTINPLNNGDSGYGLVIGSETLIDGHAFDIYGNSGFLYFNRDGTLAYTPDIYPSWSIDISGDATFSDVYISNNLTADMVDCSLCKANTFLAQSDYRIKDNVKQILDDSAYSIDNLKPVTYVNKLTGKRDVGFIAHELQEQLPFLVEGVKDGPTNQSVNYTGLIGILVKEIQELKREVATLKNKIDTNLNA
jgi:hypothetical protein